MAPVGFEPAISVGEGLQTARPVGQAPEHLMDMKGRAAAKYTEEKTEEFVIKWMNSPCFRMWCQRR